MKTYQSKVGKEVEFVEDLFQEVYQLVLPDSGFESCSIVSDFLETSRIKEGHTTTGDHEENLCGKVRILSLVRNQIFDISWLATNPLVNLRYLNLARNSLEQLPSREALDRIPNVEILLFHCNNIGIYEDITVLETCEKLRHISLFGNPIASNRKGYRQDLICALPKTTLAVDTFLISDDEFCGFTSKAKSNWPYKALCPSLKIPVDPIAYNHSEHPRLSVEIVQPLQSPTSSFGKRSNATAYTASSPQATLNQPTNSTNAGKLLPSESRKTVSNKDTLSCKEVTSLPRSSLDTETHESLGEGVRGNSFLITGSFKSRAPTCERQSNTKPGSSSTAKVRRKEARNQSRKDSGAATFHWSRSLGTQSGVTNSHRIDVHIRQLIAVRNFTSPAVLIQKTFRMYSSYCFAKRFSLILHKSVTRLQKLVRSWMLKIQLKRLEREFLMAVAPGLAQSVHYKEQSNAAIQIQKKWKQVKTDSKLQVAATAIQRRWGLYRRDLLRTKESLHREGITAICLFDHVDNREALSSAVSQVQGFFGPNSLQLSRVAGVWSFEPRVESRYLTSRLLQYRSNNVVIKAPGGAIARRLDVINHMFGHQEDRCCIARVDCKATKRSACHILAVFMLTFRRKSVARSHSHGCHFSAVLTPSAVEWISSAVALQRVFRAYKCRRVFRVAQRYREKLNATKLQGWWRKQSFLARMHFVELLAAYVAQLNLEFQSVQSQVDAITSHGCLFLEKSTWDRLGELAPPEPHAKRSAHQSQQFGGGLKCTINSMGFLVLGTSRLGLGESTRSLQGLLLRRQLRMSLDHPKNKKVQRSRHVRRKSSTEPLRRLSVASVDSCMSVHSEEDRAVESKRQRSRKKEESRADQRCRQRCGIPRWLMRRIGAVSQFEFEDEKLPVPRKATIKQILKWGAKVDICKDSHTDFGFGQDGTQVVRLTYRSPQQAKVRAVLCFCLSYSWSPVNVLTPLTSGMLRDARIGHILQTVATKEEFQEEGFEFTDLEEREEVGRHYTEFPWLQIPTRFSFAKYNFAKWPAVVTPFHHYTRRDALESLRSERAVAEGCDTLESAQGHLDQSVPENAALRARVKEDNAKVAAGGRGFETAEKALESCELGPSGLAVLGFDANSLCRLREAEPLATVQSKLIMADVVLKERETIANDPAAVLDKVNLLRTSWIRNQRKDAWKQLMKEKHQRELEVKKAKNAEFRKSLAMECARAQQVQLQQNKEKVFSIQKSKLSAQPSNTLHQTNYLRQLGKVSDSSFDNIQDTTSQAIPNISCTDNSRERRVYTDGHISEIDAVLQDTLHTTSGNLPLEVSSTRDEMFQTSESKGVLEPAPGWDGCAGERNVSKKLHKKHIRNSGLTVHTQHPKVVKNQSKFDQRASIAKPTKNFVSKQKYDTLDTVHLEQQIHFAHRMRMRNQFQKARLSINIGSSHQTYKTNSRFSNAKHQQPCHRQTTNVHPRRPQKIQTVENSTSISRVSRKQRLINQNKADHLIVYQLPARYQKHVEYEIDVQKAQNELERKFVSN